MAGQRGTGARRARGSWVARIAGTLGVIVAAVTAASVLVLNQGTARARRQASSAEEWTANQMGGGTYILIYVPDRRCLTAPTSPGTPIAMLIRCDLSLSQRWRHQFLGKDAAGRDNWRLLSAASLPRH